MNNCEYECQISHIWINSGAMASRGISSLYISSNIIPQVTIFFTLAPIFMGRNNILNFSYVGWPWKGVPKKVTFKLIFLISELGSGIFMGKK